ncbi:MAG: T9SS type A sorting domain-containing protein, partial [Bacteroidota bacterium]
TKILNPDDFIYGDSVTPVVTIHNFGTSTVTSADIYYEKNWKSHLNTFHWTGTLQTDGEVNVTLPRIIDSTWYNLFCAWTKNPNGNQDEDTTNDFKTRSYIVSLSFPDPTNVLNEYPNPTNGVITLDFGEIIDLKGTVTVFNVLGQHEQVRMDQLSLSKFQIDLGNFPSGMYFLDLRVNGKKIIKKVIVQHEL